jgi:hypothetical protein
MANVIRCPHVDSVLEARLAGKTDEQLQTLVTDHGAYAEICNECANALLHLAISDMTQNDLATAINSAYEQVSDAV